MFSVPRAEYEVVKRVLMSGLHKKIRTLAVEWHHGNPFVFGNYTSEGWERAKLTFRMPDHACG